MRLQVLQVILKPINFWLLTILFLLVFSFSVEATIAPQVYFTDLKLSKTNFLPGEAIEGEVSLWNYEGFSMSDLIFYFQLLGGEVNGVPTQMIDNQKDKTVFSLSAHEKATKTFSYRLPQNLPKGSYKFRIRLANNRGEEMSWIDKVIEIGGEGKFLLLNNYWLVKEGKDWSPGGGLEYQPGEIPQVRFDITNNSNFTINAFSKIITYKRNIGGEVVQEQTEKSIILNPKQKQTLKTSLPALTEPGTYLSEVRFYDSENKQPISNSIYFRWVIAGEGGQILFVNPDKDSYEKGEEAKIKIQFAGPAHEDVIGAGEGEIKVKIFNPKGQLIGEGKKKVQLKTGQETINVPIKEKVENPKILTEIVKGQKVFDRYEFQTKPKPTITEVKEEKKIGFWGKNKNLILIILILIVVGIGALIYYLKTKKMKGVKTLILLALFGAGILFGDYVLTATEVTGGCCDTTIVFNSPPPDQTYKPGDTIHFSGTFKITSCGNGMFFNKVTFYITEDKEIPIKDCCGDTTDNCSNKHKQCCSSGCSDIFCTCYACFCAYIRGQTCSDCNNCGCTSCSCAEGCSHCYGAKSSRFSSCNFTWCDEVKYLDTTKGYKIYKLGEIYPPDVTPGATPYSVAYDQYFTIPKDLGFGGKVRFYVQYSGTHWDCHWHWNITYQPGYIYQPPSATNLNFQVLPNPAECSISYPGARLSWSFTDPDGDSQSAYQIQVDNNSDFSSPEVDTGKVSSASQSYVTPQNALSWNTTYYWRLKVWDSQGLASDWIQGPSFQTPKHLYPEVKFTWSPKTPTTNQVVQFTDQSTCYTLGNSTIPCLSWYWTFKNGNPPNSTLQNPTTTFTRKDASTQVTLTVTDPDGYKCSKTESLNVTWPLPQWIELPPSGFLFNLFEKLKAFLLTFFRS